MQKNEQIPDDLIFSILRSLPTKSLVRFKCVCKSWLSFISQLKYGNDELILRSSSCLHSINFDESEIKAVTLGFPLKRSCNFSVIGSCNGLLCLYNYENALVVWNPWTRRYKTVSSKVGYLSGFGYDHSTDDYIIVRFIYNKSEHTAEIYSRNSDSWLQMGKLPKQFTRISLKAFSVNGALYWRGVYPANMNSYEGDIIPFNSDYDLSSILRFDLVNRKFTMIIPPDELCKKHNIDICVLGGHLCMANYDHDCHTDIWAWQGNKLFVYNQKQKTFRELKIQYAQLLSREVIRYTKSLVSPACVAGNDNESPVYNEDVRGVDIDIQDINVLKLNVDVAFKVEGKVRGGVMFVQHSISLMLIFRFAIREALYVVGQVDNVVNQKAYAPYRLPPKSLMRFKCVCKSWLSSISQLKYGNDELVLCSSFNLHSINFEESEIKAVSLGFPLKSSCNFNVIGSSNGLICLYSREALVLWNPWTRRYVSLDTNVSEECNLSGFGYDHSTDDFIIVRFVFKKLGQVVEIYSHKTDSWLQLGILPKQIIPFSRVSNNNQTALFVNGALYWQVRYIANMEYYDEEGFSYSSYNAEHVLNTILCFDLVDRKFSMIVPPDDEVCKKPVFDLCVLGGRLCMANYDHDCHTDIWAWEGNKKGNWIKLMSVPCLRELQSDNQYLSPVFLMNNGELLLKTIIMQHYKDHHGNKRRRVILFRKNHFGKKLFVYNQKQMTFRELKITYARLLSREEIRYTKSLVSLARDSGNDNERDYNMSYSAALFRKYPSLSFLKLSLHQFLFGTPMNCFSCPLVALKFSHAPSVIDLLVGHQILECAVYDEDEITLLSLDSLCRDPCGVDIDVQERMFGLQQHSTRTIGKYKQEVMEEICEHILSEIGPNCKSSTSGASLQWTIELE
ncbi:hypothetical protein EZV62_000457 [Acer yangbiense]|uniref:F-box domain-containing protein n=1 Tax=Acer yangbiense TaxID=1000413 RepID=A0A5C7IRX2_9ROSI|nr:hypothetical protein EZV62_000457 [Acer yangbiense]